MSLNPDDRVVTDCCGQLLAASMTLVNDVHISDMCLACQWLDGREHESHVTCDWTKTECPGTDWSYVNGQIVKGNA